MVLVSGGGGLHSHSLVWFQKFMGQKKFGQNKIWSKKIMAPKKLGQNNLFKIRQLTSVKNYLRNLALKFGQNRVIYS